MADDLPAHETDIAAIVQGKDGSQTPVLRFVTTLGLKVCASAPVLSDTRRWTDRLPQQAHAALVADTARRAASRAAHHAARRARAARSAEGLPVTDHRRSERCEPGYRATCRCHEKTQ